MGAPGPHARWGGEVPLPGCLLVARSLFLSFPFLPCVIPATLIAGIRTAGPLASTIACHVAVIC